MVTKVLGIRHNHQPQWLSHLPSPEKVFLSAHSVMSDSVTPWTIARQAPLFLGFSRQEYWSGLPFPSPGDVPDWGIEPESPAWAGGFFTTEPPGKPKYFHTICTFTCCGIGDELMSSDQLIVSNGAEILIFLEDDIDGWDGSGEIAALEMVWNPMLGVGVGSHILSVLPACTTHIARHYRL